MLDKEKLPTVALDAMNDVHYAELNLLNELLDRLDAVADGALSPEEVDLPLERLLEHMRQHFAGEEEQMLAAEFPSYPTHKAEHDRALAEARAACDAWRRDRDEQALVQYLERELPAWMIHHIATMDAATARFLVSRGEPYRTAS